MNIVDRLAEIIHDAYFKKYGIRKAQKVAETINEQFNLSPPIWCEMNEAPKDRVIFVRRDNGCGIDYEVVWWNDNGDGYPWKSEYNAYPEDRWDEWFDPEKIK